MKKWNSSPHPISDVRDWSKSGRFELRPDFQRREVWSKAARIMLIDTVLSDIPMPKILLYNEIKEENTYRTVIDGQQRMSAILAFLRNEFSLQSPYDGEYRDSFFKDLPELIQKDILSYSIDFNEVSDVSEEELREVFSRFNKYTVALNKQELRRADFPGDFLNLAEELSLNDYLESAGIFTIANRKRFGDVEYISELLAGLIDGAQEKKQTLDNYYQQYTNWSEDSSNSVKGRFLAILSDIEQLFAYKDKGIAGTRFRQKSDFYSLFLSVDSLHLEGYSLENKSLSFLQQDLELLDNNIAPHSFINAFSEYATRCLSDANSKPSRLWRQAFIKKILAGTYIGHPPIIEEGEHAFASILPDLDIPNTFMGCPPTTDMCSICEEEVENDSSEGLIISWTPDSKVFQLSNAQWIHAKCNTEKSLFFIEKVVNENQQDVFNNKEEL